MASWTLKRLALPLLLTLVGCSGTAGTTTSPGSSAAPATAATGAAGSAAGTPGSDGKDGAMMGKERALAVVSAMERGDFAAATATFDATMKTALPTPTLKTVWEGLVKTFGALQDKRADRVETVKGLDVHYISCRFERATLEAKVVLNGSGEVTGLFFGTPEPTTPWEAPEYVDASRFTEKDVTVGSDPWALPGTLSVPAGEGPFPAVVLVHGSGPHDRDETVMGHKPFRDLAWGLASRGVAVLRYVKRTKEHAGKLSGATITADAETVADAAAAVDLLRAHGAPIDPERVFVLGHSLGGMLAPRIAAAAPEAAGLIILAGTTRPLHKVIVAQITYLAGLDGTVDDDEKKNIAEVTAVAERLDALLAGDGADPGDSEESILGAPVAYWLDLLRFDPAAAAKALTHTPMLILQGERDYQVTLEDFAGWRDALAGRKNVTFKTYPALNHLFSAGEGPSKPEEYTAPGHVAAEVVDDVASWITTR